MKTLQINCYKCLLQCETSTIENATHDILKMRAALMSRVTGSRHGSRPYRLAILPQGLNDVGAETETSRLERSPDMGNTSGGFANSGSSWIWSIRWLRLLLRSLGVHGPQSAHLRTTARRTNLSHFRPCPRSMHLMSSKLLVSCRSEPVVLDLVSTTMRIEALCQRDSAA